MGASYTPETWDEWTAKMQAAHGNGNGHGKSLAIEAQRLLPTPSAMAPDAKVSDRARELYSSTDRLGDVVDKSSWGDYAAAIARWEAVLGRPAPAPTMTSAKGNPQLSPAFVEWLMGLPAGWVTDVPGITRNEALKALGNGVVPAQAAAAIRTMLSWQVAA
jgi:DNA (cytosine-5)-methyltransferase 1